MSGPTTSVFLLAENRLLREALARILGNRTTLNIVGATTFEAPAWSQIENARPDVILSDSPDQLFGPNNRITRLRISAPNAKLVLVGMERDEDQFLMAVSEGVLGYTLKDASSSEIMAAIRSVAKGEAVCPPCLMLALFQGAARCVKRTAGGKGSAELSLSRREQQLAQHLALGMTNKEIASKLNISDQTVKNHVHRILRKLGAKDRQTIAEFWEAEYQISSVETTAPDLSSDNRALKVVGTRPSAPHYRQDA